MDIGFVSAGWYIGLLVMYFNSKNEAFWLAFFLTTTDGFFGFLGNYSVLLTAIPGMPGIELAQFYILLGFIKIAKTKTKITPFYKNWTNLLFVYVLFLVLVGMANGLSGDANLYFKIVKIILPLGLIYTIPRLMKNIEDYIALLDLVFLVFMVAFAAQLYTVFTGLSPSVKFKPIQKEEMEIGRNLRSSYNVSATLVSLCGALFLLTLKNQKYFSKLYLNVIVICCFGMAFLSATRGWIIGFGLIIVFYNIFVNKLKLKNLFFIVLVFGVLLTVALSIEKLNKQIMFSLERTLTLESLAKGDISADGTLIRLEERGPRVMEVWSSNPIFGWGFSNTYFDSYDVHVGNQTLLLLSGIVGLILLYSFILFVSKKIISLYRSNITDNPFKKACLVFPVFFLGWFFIHSTSVQQFTYFGIPNSIFPQAIILALVNLVVTYKSKTQIPHLKIQTAFAEDKLRINARPL